MVFKTAASSADIEITIYREGGFLDHCDNWEMVTDQELDEAFTICLDYLLMHRDEAAALGLDPSLLEELWR